MDIKYKINKENDCILLYKDDKIIKCYTLNEINELLKNNSENIPFLLKVFDSYYDKMLQDKIDWKNELKLLDELVQKQNNILPEETILFHSSKYLNPKFNTEISDMIFFGLYDDISLWYTTELLDINYDYKEILYTTQTNEIMFLNIYKTTRDMEYHYIKDINSEIPLMNNHPLDTEECYNKPCLHAQFAYHSKELEVSLEYPADLSVELTIPIEKINENIEWIAAYTIDVNLLIQNSKNKDFNPRLSLNKIIF